MTRRGAGLWVIAVLVPLGSPLVASAQMGQSSSETTSHPINIKASEIKWDRIFPELGERSAEISILRVDPKSHATHLMIRVPPDFHVPKHWHTANETHTIMSGTFVIECEGRREALGAGSFNFIPSRMVHEAWTTAREGALLFITVDSAWDVNWVNGPPKPQDLLGGARPPAL